MPDKFLGYGVCVEERNSLTRGKIYSLYDLGEYFTTWDDDGIYGRSFHKKRFILIDKILEE